MKKPSKQDDANMLRMSGLSEKIYFIQRCSECSNGWVEEISNPSGRLLCGHDKCVSKTRVTASKPLSQNRKSFNSNNKKEIRQTLAGLYGWRCYYCGVEVKPHSSSIPSKDVVHIDHRIPLSRGGTSEIENMVLSCRDCNSRKGVMTDNEFVRYLETEKI